MYLANCGLSQFASLNWLPDLKHLNLSGNTNPSLKYHMNRILTETFSKPHPLETLDLSYHPLEEIHVNRMSFPSLRHLVCGSSETHFISFDLLVAVSERKLRIVVLDEFKSNLLYPVSQLLKDPDSLSQHLNDKILNLGRIRHVQQRQKTFYWLLRQNRSYDSLVLSGQQDFCKLHFSSILKHPSLSDIRSLYLNNCGLDNLEFRKVNFTAFTNLELLDISNNNKLTEIFTTLSEHKKLEKLIFDGNHLETVEIQSCRKKFPKLKYIQAGSERTTHIAMKLLEAVSKGKPSIGIPKQYREHLDFPPYEVLADEDSLKAYIKEMTSSEENKSSVWANTTENVLMLLGKQEAGKTSLRRTLVHNTPRVTLTDDRTVVLERDLINLDDEMSITTLDFGGHPIYELEYPVFLRGQNIIVLIVVDLVSYNKERHDELVTNWLTNCVLCAECSVIFVPSKTDMLSADEVDEKVELMKTLIEKWLSEEILFIKKVKTDLQKGSPTSIHTDDLVELDRSCKFFDKFKVDLKIMPTSSIKKRGLEELKEEVKNRVKTKYDKISPKWEKIWKFVKHSRKQYHISFQDIAQHLVTNKASKGLVRGLINFFSGPSPADDHDSIRGCLRYLSHKGVILWYPQNEQYIYNNTDNMLKLHKQLFRHDHDTRMQFKDEYKEFVKTKTLFDRLKRNFLSSGILTRNQLKCLWMPDPNFDTYQALDTSASSITELLDDDEFEGMIELLKANNHCFEDRKTDKHRPRGQLKFPWLIKSRNEDIKELQILWPEKIPIDHVEFQYIYTFCRKLPPALYHRISVSLHKIVKRDDDRRDLSDRVYVQSGNIKLLIRRHLDKDNPKLTVQIRAPSREIELLWQCCRDSYYKVVDNLISASPVVTYDKAFICPHCLLRGRDVNSADKLHLDYVMGDRCDEATTASCFCPDIEGHTRATVPAAFLRPLDKGNSFRYRQTLLD